MSLVIYPPLSESVWGTAPSVHPFLYSQFHEAVKGYSYHDFAGSGVVHLTGGVSAIIGNILLGRRIMLR